jgi:hypothetical protein
MLNLLRLMLKWGISISFKIGKTGYRRNEKDEKDNVSHEKREEDVRSKGQGRKV